jgi:hypothetical protein
MAVGVVDIRTVAIAAAAQVAVAVPPVLLARAMTSDDETAESWLPVAATVVAFLAAPAVAGVVAGRRKPDAPLLHAAIAAAAAWVFLTIVTVIRLVATDRSVIDALLTIVTFAPIMIGVAVVAAFVATRKPVPEPASAPPSQQEIEL